MIRLLPITLGLISGFAVLGQSLASPTLAQSCVAATSCGPQPIQFQPGDWISVEIVNLTKSLVEVQQVSASSALVVTPGETIFFRGSGNTSPNLSLIFADINGLSLKLDLFQPERQKLRIEIRPGNRPPGDRSVYLNNDGRLRVF
jgi:hypothetical protein